MDGLFGSTILEVALSMFFIYFLLSLMCSHINELIAGLFKSRAKDLERGIENLVCDPQTARAVLDHPLIKALGNTDAETLPVRLFTRAEAAVKNLRGKGLQDVAGKPEYIPARTFAIAIFDQLAPSESQPITVERLRQRALELSKEADDGQQSLGKALLSLIDQSGVPQRFAVTVDDVKAMIGNLVESLQQAADSPGEQQRLLTWLQGAITSAETLDEIRKNVTLLPESGMRTTILDFIDKGQSDLAAVRKSVELWYDHAMERVSGIYKRRTQVWLLVTAALISCGIGADSVNMAQTLFRNADLRQSLADRAGQVTSTPDGAFVLPAASAGADGTTTVSTTVRLGSTGPMTTTTTTMVISSTQAILDELDTVRQLFDYDEIWSGAWLASSEGRSWFLGRLPGMLITTLAISLGAPFWFDLLQRVVNVRSTGSKPARSVPEEQAAR